jgi:hypothetical protein
VDTLLFKLIATPLIIGIVTLISRRLGPAISGVLIGLPLTSGPVVLFLALDHGAAFAAATAVGIIAGTISQVTFCLVYSRVAFRLSWWATLLAGWLAFAILTWALLGTANVAPPLWVLACLAALVLALRLMPRVVAAPSTSESPWWDIPARMLVATAFVLLLTGLAARLGPHLSGLLAPFPLYASILASFAHRLQGPAAAVRMLRGLVLGLFTFVAFFLIIALLIVPLGIPLAFVAATATALALQAAFLVALYRASLIEREFTPCARPAK